MTHHSTQPTTEDVELLQQKLEFAEFEWNRATDGMKERDATIVALKARIVNLERGLTWIVNSPSAHPANMVKVADDALSNAGPVKP